MSDNIVSECFIQPKQALENSKHHFHLTPWDLMLSHPQHYVQYGLLFAKDNHHKEDHDVRHHHHHHDFTKILDRLKNSLSLALLLFYPFAGRVVKEVVENADSSSSYYSLYIDCNNKNEGDSNSAAAGGVKFIHATSNASVSDLVSPVDVPSSLLQSFFDDEVVALDYGDSAKSLLVVRVVQLADGGVFIGFIHHHCVADGNSMWHFINTLSEIFQANTNSNNNHAGCYNVNVSNPPILQRWFPDGHGPILTLPLTSNSSNTTDVFITKDSTPKCRARIFHFSSHTTSKLKAKAIEECNNNNNNNMRISSFQSLAAFIWRCITKARRLRDDENTIFLLPVNNRSKLDPPLSGYYFGNSVGVVKGGSKVGELFERGHGWAALKMNQALVEYGDLEVRQGVDDWLRNSRRVVAENDWAVQSPPGIVLINDYTKFDIFGNEFGELGRPKAFLAGNRNHMRDGTVFCYSTSTGAKDGRSRFDIAMEVWLLPNTMSNLESDQEFMELVS